MEMDEIISQLQLWRQKGTTGSNESEDNDTNTEPTSSSYHSEAYDRLFKSHGGPESDAPIPVLTEKKYAADDEMIAKVNKTTICFHCSFSTVSFGDLFTQSLSTCSLFRFKHLFKKAKAAHPLPRTGNTFSNSKH